MLIVLNKKNEKRFVEVINPRVLFNNNLNYV